MENVTAIYDPEEVPPGFLANPALDMDTTYVVDVFDGLIPLRDYRTLALKEAIHIHVVCQLAPMGKRAKLSHLMRDPIWH